jgi:pyridoxine 4-dehydrogenase
MSKQMNLGGSFTLPGASLTLNRMGYGAMCGFRSKWGTDSI